MKRIHIIGRKNHGKTTLVVDLVKELSRRGLKIGTIKHTHHQHELDTPGKDSHRHRIAGSACVGILSPSMNACFWPVDQEGESRYAVFDTHFSDCDLVLVEGDTQTSAERIEGWRAAVGGDPLASQDTSIAAIVADADSLTDLPIPMLNRADLAGVANWICHRLDIQPNGN